MKIITLIAFVAIAQFSISQLVWTQPSNTSSSCDGVAFVNSSGLGSWSWYDSSSNLIQNGGDSLTGLCVGNYLLTFDNGSGPQNVSFTIIENPCNGFSLNLVSENDFYTNCSGSITVSVVGGNAPYTYSWTNSTTSSPVTSSSLLSNLCSDTYNVFVTDSYGCTNSSATTIGTDTCSFYVEPIFTPITSANSCDASINLTFPVSSGSVSCYWSTGASTYFIDNLCAAVYSVTVQDNFGCSNTYTYPVIDPCANFIANLNPQAATNSVICDGEINATVSGGTLPYSYLWNNGSTIEDLTNLCVGSYSLTVEDNLGCVVTSSTSVLDSNAISCNGIGTGVNINNVSTLGMCDGSLEIYGISNTYFVSYLWSNGATTSQISNLCVGYYDVTAIDSNNCDTYMSFYVTYDSIQPNPLNATVVENDESQVGQCDGLASVIVNSGIAPFQYFHSNGNTTATAINLCPGLYTVLVVDAASDSLYIDYLISSDSSNIYYNPYLDSINVNTLFTDVVQSCLIDINTIDTAFVNYTISNHPDSITIVWSIHSSSGWEDIGASYFVDPSISGVFTVVLELFCPIKSGEQYVKIFTELYIDVNQLSVNDKIIKPLEIYPNPFTDKITIHTNNEMYSEVSIVNNLGQVVYNARIDNNGSEYVLTGLDQIEKGNYLLYLKGTDGLKVSKLVK